MACAPHFRARRVCDITIEWLQRNGIETLVLDLDNTTVGWGLSEMSQDILDWILQLQRNGIAVAIFTNNLRTKRVKALVRHYGIAIVPAGCNPFFWKPLPLGILYTIRKLRGHSWTTLVVDDQLSGIQAGVTIGCQTLLVDPLTDKDAKYTRKFKRPRQARALESFAASGHLPDYLPRQP